MQNNVLFIFIDGLGIPKDLSNNHLNKFKTISSILKTSKPIDAIMDVDGIPQSGTGQTSLFCGINAQKKLGRHQYAFPCNRLKKIIKEQNIFKILKDKGLSYCFSNAYHTSYFKRQTKRHSVSTWMCFYSDFEFLLEKDLLNGEAVYHDITNRRYIDGCVPFVSPKDAAKNLLNIALKNDLTLFEYFLSDRAGHGRIDISILEELDIFLKELLRILPDNTGFILTSDHGNIEDPDSRSHTKNAVPFYTKNLPGENLPDNLAEVKDYILNIFEKNI